MALHRLATSPVHGAVIVEALPEITTVAEAGFSALLHIVIRDDAGCAANTQSRKQERNAGKGG